jgi:hypothetical protein
MWREGSAWITEVDFSENQFMEVNDLGKAVADGAQFAKTSGGATRASKRN